MSNALDQRRTGFMTHAQPLDIRTTEPTANLWAPGRNTNGSFGDMSWVEISAAEPVTGSPGVTSVNSVYGNAVVGVAASTGGTAAYQSRVTLGREASNVISGNSGNGIAVIGGSSNTIAMNQIGTDAAGTSAVPNGLNGILLTRSASGNTIGGSATANNDPTAGSGDEPLGNARDGVAISGADGNALLGTTFQQSPFVFYNVLSGNGGNGLRITATGGNNLIRTCLIAGNLGHGIVIGGDCTGTRVIGNTTRENGIGNVDLAAATGITYVP